jgi:mono/diheme cytochrome c family protein
MRKTSVKLVGLCGIAGWILAAGYSAVAGQQPSRAIGRGEYLVNGTGCGDCHTPMKMGPSGPVPDSARLLSGHPEKLDMPAPPKLGQGPWLGVVSATFTAWAGPWGTSFTANLTPDRETGLGGWTAQTFVDAIRAGRHQGRGRQLLPPMPYIALRNLTDDDLRAIFAYLETIPPFANRVPDPVAPDLPGPR